MNIKIKSITLLVLLAASACSNESKVKTAVIDNYKQDEKAEFDKTFGTSPKGLAKDLRDLYDKKRTFVFNEIKETGEQTEGTLVVKNINRHDYGGMVFFFGLAQKKLEAEKITSLDAAWKLLKAEPQYKNLPPHPEDTPLEEYRYHFIVHKEKDGYKVVSIKELKT